MKRLRMVSSTMEQVTLRTRMPFRYGIATATQVPHLLVRGEFEIDGARQIGIAADHLPPKWFTKDPNTSYEDDVKHLRAAIEAACAFAEEVGEVDSAFALWKRVYDAPAFSPTPLVHAFAASSVERAAIDAFCRGTGQTFSDALRNQSLGIDYPPAAPLRSLIVRHTIGLSDPLSDGEIPANERLDDGLPQSLQACVQRYGLTDYKIKLSGDARRDVVRLVEIAKAIPDAQAFTLDGNENFRDLEHFRQFWDRFAGDAALERFRAKLLFVEQPLHRDTALSTDLNSWSERPAMIIDESDDRLESAPAALRAGYRGCSYKSCKGVFKGIANAVRMKRDNAIISAEDLTTIGPVSLMQDLAVVAALGIPHVERNGHHYFRGLSMFPREIQDGVLAAHPDLYEDGGGFATLRIRGGRIDVGSVVDAPFGYGDALAGAIQARLR